MVKVYFDFNDGQFHFKLNNSLYYNEILGVLKTKYRCTFNPKSKSWSIKSAITANGIVIELRGYDDIDISDDDLYLLEDFIYPDDSTFKKIKLSPSKELLEKHPPLVGKPPYENFQLEAIKKGLTQNRIIYDIDMGHGKTYISCMVIGSLLLQNKIDKVFIIARPEGVENFRLEILGFLSPYIKEEDIGIVDTKHREIEDFFDKKIIITNYITYRLSCGYYNKLSKSNAKKPTKKTIKFSKWGSNRLLLLDEAQGINNYSSAQSHFVHLYKDDFDRRISMSGSLGYKFLHYYSQCKFHIPNSLPYSFSEWTNYVADKGTHFSATAITSLREDKVKEFKEKLLDKLQVTYRNCIDIPDNTDDIIYIQMNDKLKKIYRLFTDELINSLIKIKNKNLDGNSLLNKFMLFTKATSDPILLNDDQRGSWKFTDSPKLEIIDSLVEKYVDEENRKIVIWGSHPKVLNALADYLKKYNPYVVHGSEDSSVKKSDRFELVQDFRKNKKRNILITSYVLSTSINIVEATRQIYFDLPLDSDFLVQSKKRIHRQGQKEPVITHYLLYNNSIDIYVWNEILMRKNNTKNLLSSKEELSLEDYKTVFAAKAESYLSYT